MISIQTILLLFLLAAFTTVAIDYIEIETELKIQLQSSVLLLLGGGGLLTVPSLYTQLDSPYYTLFAVAIGITIVYLGWKQYNSDQIVSLVPKLSYATISIIGVYFAGVYIPPIRQLLIETVANHTVQVLNLFSFDLNLVSGPEYGYLSEYQYTAQETTYATYINIACTGIGAFSVVSGIITISSTTLKKKLQMWVGSGVVIYLLNILRNVFVSYAFFTDSFSMIPSALISPYQSDPNLTSFVVAEVYISQLLSSLILFIIFVWVYERTTLFEELEEHITEI